MLTRDDVVRHAALLPSAWKPVVQAVTNHPHDDAVTLVDITMYGLGETVYDLPVITISEGRRGGYAWRVDIGGAPVDRGIAFGLGSAVGYGTMSIFDHRRECAARPVAYVNGPTAA